LFLADGVLSLADLSLANGFPLLAGARSAVALLVLIASGPMIALMAITPRAPKPILIPLIVFAWWAGPAMAFPLALWKVPHLAFGLGIGQISLALAVWFAFRGDDRKTPSPATETPAFSWRYLLVAAPVAAFLFLALAMTSSLLGLATHVELLTGGYARLRPDGIYLVERKFHSGDREVRLTGMMHIASREFYSSLLSGIDSRVPSIVLVEGVTDRRRLLGGRTLTYERLASFLNVTPQSKSVFSDQVFAGLEEQISPESKSVQSSKDSRERGIDFKHADVDVETFHPQTIGFIIAVIGLFQSADLRELLAGVLDPLSPISNEDAQAQVIEDILVLRNRRLTSEIESSLRDYRRVIVPWGAMHLPEIESWLQEREFVRGDEVNRKALSFW
jgi:hypothetical protein